MDNSPAKEVIYLQSYCPLTPANYKLLLLTPHNYKLFLLTPPNYKLLLLTPTNSILSQEFPERPALSLAGNASSPAGALFLQCRRHCRMGEVACETEQ